MSDKELIALMREALIAADKAFGTPGVVADNRKEVRTQLKTAISKSS